MMTLKEQEYQDQLFDRAEQRLILIGTLQSMIEERDREIERLRSAVLNQAGDNLCIEVWFREHITGTGWLPPKESR